MRMSMSICGFTSIDRERGLLVAGDEGENADDEPAAHLANEHLQRLDDGLFEVVSLHGVFGVAVAYTHHVLWHLCEHAPLALPLIGALLVSRANVPDTW